MEMKLEQRALRTGGKPECSHVSGTFGDDMDIRERWFLFITNY